MLKTLLRGRTAGIRPHLHQAAKNISKRRMLIRNMHALPYGSSLGTYIRNGRTYDISQSRETNRCAENFAYEKTERR